jgi:hypothetical protein
MKENLNSAYEILDDFWQNDALVTEKPIKNPAKLLILGGDYFYQSVIGWKFSRRDYYPYIKGYEETANLLGLKMESDPNLKSLFLPMCYLYRNAVELGLKRILIEGCNYSYEDGKSLPGKNKHSVSKLWKEIKKEISEYNSQNDSQTICDTEKYIIQFQGIDSDSNKFRYPVNKVLNFYYKNEKRYSITNVSSWFRELMNFLSGVDYKLSDIRDFEAEMRSEFGPEPPDAFYE